MIIQMCGVLFVFCEILPDSSDGYQPLNVAIITIAHGKLQFIEWQLEMERKTNQVLQNQQEVLIRLNEIAGKSNEKVEENLFEQLPFQHLTLVIDFENELENLNIRNKFIDFLKRVGGSTPPDATRCGLRAIFLDNIA
ncbi:uncharacterized protein LOC124155127 [Ischnura elegans]|uniref:uncharacterized protein LOC124155126 n=1 Tax=Ischnura elegans TaxID=197161 RepID=UPI001ED8AEB3|nr:uncharacterized protein LOC124155126 [Ischnura elegans]XP_046384813.1 uncharacterized protein LOC124155127 [Ischnura elegans]